MTNYNGWTNWDTWNANLWLTSYESNYYRMMQCEDVATLEVEARDVLRLIVDGIDLDKVNWQEIYDSLHEGE